MAEFLTLAQIMEARINIQSLIHRTPLERSHTFSAMAGAELYLKMENLQKTGSFKVRGAANKVSRLTETEKEHGVIAASAGNHAQGVAMAAARLGIPATVVMPEGAPLAKVVATEGYGARVVLAGSVYDEAYAQALTIQAQTGATFIHPFDDLDVMAGQGTIALEILEDLPDLDAILVPVGGGGLIAGIAAAVKTMKPKARVVGVQAAGAPSMQRAMQAGQPVTLAGANTIADGIAVKTAGTLTFTHVQRFVDEIVTVEEEEVSAAILDLMERSKSIAEGAGAVALAAVLHNKVQLKGHIALLISGGNIDVNILAQIIERGLRRTGRSMVFRTVLPDRPGNLEKLIALLARERANIVSVEQVRNEPSVPLRFARVTVTLETQSFAHQEGIIADLHQGGYAIEVL